MTYSAADAYARALPEMLALDAASVMRVNVDVPAAVAMARLALSKMRAHRAALDRLGASDVAHPERVELYARALSHANQACAEVRRDPPAISGPYEAALRVRDTLRGDVVALIGRGLIPEQSLDGFKGLRGYQNVASDLDLLVRVLKASWDKIQGRCATRPIELTRATTLASRVRLALEHRDEGCTRVETAADLRARCFTLFVRAYDDVRRAVTFLRWREGDADVIAPSIYTTRKRRSAS